MTVYPAVPGAVESSGHLKSWALLVYGVISYAQPALKLLGHLVTRSDSRLLVHRTYEHQLRQLYGTSVLSTVIPEASAFKVALSCRQPVNFYAPTSKAAQLTADLGDELLRRISDADEKRRIA